jgi:hypothetical protein
MCLIMVMMVSQFKPDFRPNDFNADARLTVPIELILP